MPKASVPHVRSGLTENLTGSHPKSVFTRDSVLLQIVKQSNHIKSFKKCYTIKATFGYKGRHIEDEMENTRTNENRKNFKIKPNIISYVATYNVNSLMQIGKIKIITDLMDQHKIHITVPQEMRNTDQDPFESQAHRNL